MWHRFHFLYVTEASIDHLNNKDIGAVATDYLRRETDAWQQVIDEKLLSSTLREALTSAGIDANSKKVIIWFERKTSAFGELFLVFPTHINSYVGKGDLLPYLCVKATAEVRDPAAITVTKNPCEPYPSM